MLGDCLGLSGQGPYADSFDTLIEQLDALVCTIELSETWWRPNRRRFCRSTRHDSRYYRAEVGVVT